MNTTKTFSGIIERMDSSLYGHFVMVPENISTFFKSNSIKRLIAKYNGVISIHCALMPYGNGNSFIHVNKDIQKQLKVCEGQTINVELTEDTSKYGMYAPEEFLEFIDQDPVADRYFHSLSTGKQRSLLHIMGKPKNSDTRLKKVLGILTYLKNTKGSLDFKELNEALKNTHI